MSWSTRLTGALSFLLSIMPLVLQVVSEIERLLPSASGAQKKKLAQEVVRAHLDGLGLPMTDKSLAKVEAQIDRAISIQNKAGLFAHKKKASPPGNGKKKSAAKKRR